ncbi:type III pantothenate kinase [Candidatus Pseudothioglobus singularis]|nr:type III pantothenate kinase [Candidatus Pseudothioglobus singularis]MDB4822538.1 type III pantothenate kinase [Candidatus Pseudothioglobus singularis]
MSQSNLYIDIGNSAIKWRTSDSKVFSEDIENFSIKVLNQSNAAWLSAVAHSGIVQEISSHFEIINIIKPLKRFGNLTVSYDDPSMLGVDRFSAMLGAINHFPNNPLLVVDIGSAITFDVIDKNGLHHGGLIMPGMKALRGSFEKFKTSDLSLDLKGLANNTDDAWRQGTYAMMVGAINYQIESFQSNFSDGVVAVSGGQAKEIKKELPKSIVLFDNLVLDGLESYSQSMG